MKTFKKIKTLAALSVIGMLFFSCPLDTFNQMGTLVINMPGRSSARAADELPNEEWEDFIDSLSFKIVFSGGPVSKDDLVVSPGRSFSIVLAAGNWNINVIAYNADGSVNAQGVPQPVNVIAGVNTPITFTLLISMGVLEIRDKQVYAFFENFTDYNVSSNISSGSGRIANGKLNYSAGTPDSSQLEPISDFLYELKEINGDGVTISDNDAHFLVLELLTDNGNKHLQLYNHSTNETPISRSYIYESAVYVYVDKDVNITAPGTNPMDDYGFTYAPLNLNFRKGWNVMCISRIEEIFYNTYTWTYNLSITVGMPKNIKWVIFDEMNDPGVNNNIDKALLGSWSGSGSDSNIYFIDFFDRGIWWGGPLEDLNRYSYSETYPNPAWIAQGGKIIFQHSGFTSVGIETIPICDYELSSDGSTLTLTMDGTNTKYTLTRN